MAETPINTFVVTRPMGWVRDIHNEKIARLAEGYRCIGGLSHVGPLEFAAVVGGEIERGSLVRPENVLATGSTTTAVKLRARGSL